MVLNLSGRFFLGLETGADSLLFTFRQSARPLLKLYLKSIARCSDVFICPSSSYMVGSCPFYSSGSSPPLKYSLLSRVFNTRVLSDFSFAVFSFGADRLNGIYIVTFFYVVILIRAFPFSSAFKSALSSSSLYLKFWPDTDFDEFASPLTTACVGRADLKALLAFFLDAGLDKNLSFPMKLEVEEDHGVILRD